MHDDLVLDPVALARIQRVGGVRLLREMLELFLQHAPARIGTAQASHREGNFRGVEQSVHSLKSSAGNVGARTIQHLADTIERMAVESEPERIGPLLLDLQTAWERLEPLLQRAKEGLKS